MLKLNCARSGVLYHFTHSMKTVTKIVDAGLKTSSVAEDHSREVADNPRMKKRLSKEYAERPEMAFVSLGRSPSVVVHAAYEADPEDPAWVYAVIFNADRLSDIAKIIPYQYNATSREFDLVIYSLEDDPDGITYSTDVSGDRIIHSTGNEKPGEAPLDRFLDAFYEMADDPNCPLTCEEEAGMWEIKGRLTKDYPFRKLPDAIQNMLISVGYESEDRMLFPNAKPETIIEGTKKAIIGILVPDTKYWNWQVEEFREAFPEYPVYAYRDPKVGKSHTGRKVPPEAYRLPTA